MALYTCDLALKKQKQESGLISTASARPAKVPCQGPVSIKETKTNKQGLCLSGAFRLVGDDSWSQSISDKWGSGGEDTVGASRAFSLALGDQGSFLEKVLFRMEPQGWTMTKNNGRPKHCMCCIRCVCPACAAFAALLRVLQALKRLYFSSA